MSATDEWRDEFLAETVREITLVHNCHLWKDDVLAKLLVDTLARFGYEVVRNVNAP